MIYFRIFKHLLPRARAWRITIDKNLRRFFEGLSGIAKSVRDNFDAVWLDLFPHTTRTLSEWEDQFGLENVGLSESKRRDRLAAAWRAIGGQDPRYIQDTLQAAGFYVFVHDWWVPNSAAAVGIHAAAVARNPLAHLKRDSGARGSGVDCGEPLALCGEPFAEAGNSFDLIGYPLVNKILFTVPDVMPMCGEPSSACGEPFTLCGNYVGFRDDTIEYQVPNDPETWPYFLYIGGETFGDLASIPSSRREEFEALCLKLCPSQLWLGILVDYE